MRIERLPRPWLCLMWQCLARRCLRGRCLGGRCLGGRRLGPGDVAVTVVVGSGERMKGEGRGDVESGLWVGDSGGKEGAAPEGGAVEDNFAVLQLVSTTLVVR